MPELSSNTNQGTNKDFSLTPPRLIGPDNQIVVLFLKHNSLIFNQPNKINDQALSDICQYLGENEFIPSKAEFKGTMVTFIGIIDFIEKVPSIKEISVPSSLTAYEQNLIKNKVIVIN